ncbi:MAG: S41 family peptidase, partial [Bacteroidota bacterium]
FRNQVMRMGEDANSVQATHRAVEHALVLLEDNHSFFISSNNTYLYADTDVRCERPLNGSRVIPNNIGYVSVPGFLGETNSEDAKDFAKTIQEQIRIADIDSLDGWIVDLRWNSGGNMWPMLAGIGPLLGPGPAGYFIDPEGNESSWSYTNGISYSGRSRQTQILEPYQLKNPDPRVAILIDNACVSSGEAIAISFKGRPDTQFFGKPTCGFSTGNRIFRLPHNTTLVLTGATMADRNKKAYGAAVEPDVLSTKPGEEVQQAIEYLMN